jgi:hypothetical protein
MGCNFDLGRSVGKKGNHAIDYDFGAAAPLNRGFVPSKKVFRAIEDAVVAGDESRAFLERVGGIMTLSICDRVARRAIRRKAE